MPRNMSFAITTLQVQNRSKDVTRRFGWWFLKPGDVVNVVEKAQGLKKGEKLKRLGQIRIKSVRREPLNAITAEDVAREGFPDWCPEQFVDMLVQHNKVEPTKHCNRIEFEYLEEAA